MKTVVVNDNINCDVDANGMRCGIEVIEVEKEKMIQWSKTLEKSTFLPA